MKNEFSDIITKLGNALAVLDELTTQGRKSRMMVTAVENLIAESQEELLKLQNASDKGEENNERRD